MTLLCIENGESTFSVKVDRDDIVDDLKVSIHARLEIDTPSKDLVLWRVSIPVADDDDEEEEDFADSSRQFTCRREEETEGNS
jgi:hypothetical protein